MTRVCTSLLLTLGTGGCQPQVAMIACCLCSLPTSAGPQLKTLLYLIAMVKELTQPDRKGCCDSKDLPSCFRTGRKNLFPSASLAQTVTLMCLLCPSSCSSPCLDFVPVARQFSCCSVNKDKLLCKHSLHCCDISHHTWCSCQFHVAAVCCLLPSSSMICLSKLCQIGVAKKTKLTCYATAVQYVNAKHFVMHDCSMKMQVVFTCMNAKYTVMSVDQCNAMSVTAITKT